MPDGIVIEDYVPAENEGTGGGGGGWFFLGCHIYLCSGMKIKETNICSCDFQQNSMIDFPYFSTTHFNKKSL